MDNLDETLKTIFLTPELLAIKRQDVKTQREFFNQRAQTLFNITEKPNVAYNDFEIMLADRMLKSRLYTPLNCCTDGAIVFYHGGGWILHNIEVYQLFCFYLATYAECKVISVDYRLAPEYPFPAGVQDAIDSFEWIHQNVNQFDIDSNKLIVAGDSAGGNFVGSICHERALNQLSLPLAQILIYPAMDLSKVYPSQELFKDEQYSLSQDWLQMMFNHYFTNPSRQAFMPMASPLRYQNFSGQPPVLLIIAEHDPLRDEGLAYGEKLLQAEVPVELIKYSTMAHGFATFIGIVDEAVEAVKQMGIFSKKQFSE